MTADGSLSGRARAGYIVALMVAYAGATIALFAPIQNVLPRMIEDVAVPADRGIYLGLATGLGALAAMIANPLAGHFTDRGLSRDNRGTAILVGLAGGSATLYLLGQQKSIAGITIAWILAQITINIAYSPMAASVVDHMPSASWGMVWGCVGVAQSVGLVIGFVVVVNFLPHPAVGMLGVACIYGLCLIPLAVAVYSLPRKQAMRRADGTAPLLALTRSQAFGRVWIGKFMVMLATSIALLYLYYYLQDVIHYHPPGDGQTILVGIVTVATIATAGTIGRLADKSGGYRRYAVASGAVMGVAGFALAAIPTWDAAIIGSVVLGVGYGAFMMASQALSALVLPAPGNVARDLGIMNIASAAPQVLGPPVAALFIYLGTGYRGLFALAGALMLVAGAVFARVRA